jgi:hypothetical protein
MNTYAYNFWLLGFIVGGAFVALCCARYVDTHATRYDRLYRHYHAQANLLAKTETRLAAAQWTLSRHEYNAQRFPHLLLSNGKSPRVINANQKGRDGLQNY